MVRRVDTSNNRPTTCTSRCPVGLTSEQARPLERFSAEFRERHIEAPHTRALVAVDTFFVGVLKGVGKVYLQTVIDCDSRYAWARLFTNKLPVPAVQTLNNEVLPTFEVHGAVSDAVLSDNGREFSGRADHWTPLLFNPYELFLRWRVSARRPPRSIGRRATASWSGCTAPCSTSICASRVAPSGTRPWPRCRPHSMPSSCATTATGRIRDFA